MPFPDDPDASAVSPRLGAGRLPARRDTPPMLDPTVEALPTTHRLPAHQGKLERITEHVTGLSEDLQEWVELKVEVTKRDLEGKVQAGVIAGVTGALGGLFVLICLGLWFAVLWRFTGLSMPVCYALGFTTVAVILLAIAAVFGQKLKRLGAATARYNAARKARKEARGH